MISDTMSRAERVKELAREALNVPGVPNAPVLVHDAALAPSEVLTPEQTNEPALLKDWKLRTLKDAYEPRPPLEYAVPGIISFGALVIMYGAPGSLKSMLLADLAVCLAGGAKWLPSLNSAGSGMAIKQAPVLWIDLDNGARRTDERFCALGHARSIPSDAPLYYTSLPSPWLDASQEALIAELIELIRYKGAKVVVIDNLGLILGSVQENDAQMAVVMGHLRRLCEETGAVVIVIHHQRKSNGATTRKGESLRGHSSIEAALDLALHVERKEGTDEIVVTPTKIRGATFSRFGAVFAYDHATDGVELEKACFYGIEIDNSSSDDGIDSAVFEALRESEELNKGALKEAVKRKHPHFGINRIGKRIDILASERRLICLEAKKGSTEKLYRLP